MSLTSVLIQFLALASLLLILSSLLQWFERRLMCRAGGRAVADAHPFETLAMLWRTLGRVPAVGLNVGTTPRALLALLAVALTLASFFALPVGTLRAFGRTNVLGLGELPHSLLAAILLSSLARLARGLYARPAGLSGIDAGVGDPALEELAYSLPFLLALGGAVASAGSLSLAQLVRAQGDGVPSAVLQPLGLAVCGISVLVFGGGGGGQQVTRSAGDISPEFADAPAALVHLAGSLQQLFAGALLATLYLAGAHGPGADSPHWLLLKTAALSPLLAWLRVHWLEDLRERLGIRLWPLLTCLSLLNLAVTALLLDWAPPW